MIVCRPSKFPDLDREDVRGLIMRGIRTSALESIDWQKVWGMFRSLLAGPQNHAALAFKDNVAVAYLGAMRTTTWTPQDKFLIVGWFSEHKGAGMLLLKDLLKRAREDSEIGEVMVLVNADPEQKLSRVLSKYGATPVPTFNIKV